MAHHFMIVSRPGFALAYSLVPLRLDWTGDFSVGDGVYMLDLPIS
jgi:hypothetical protein